MATTLKIDEQTKGRFDAFQSKLDDGATQTAALAELLDIADLHRSEETLSDSELEAVRLARSIACRAADAIAGVLIAEKSAHDEKVAQLASELEKRRDAIIVLEELNNALEKRIQELRNYEDEVLQLREKVAELDATKQSLDQLAKEIAANREDAAALKNENAALKQQVTELIATITADRKIAQKKEDENASLREQVARLLDRLEHGGTSAEEAKGDEK